MRPAGGAPRSVEPRRDGRIDAAGQASRRGRFADALRAAAGAVAAKATPGGALPARSALARRASADEKDATLAGRRAAAADDERAAAPPPQPQAAGAAAEIAAAAPPELRAAVRALPLAIEASRLRDGAPLSLSFGRSLDVELRPAAGGVELVLRPDARLARACQAELPRVVAALAARGVSVARAQVRARASGAAGAAGPRVDLPAALR